MTRRCMHATDATDECGMCDRDEAIRALEEHDPIVMIGAMAVAKYAQQLTTSPQEAYRVLLNAMFVLCAAADHPRGALGLAGQRLLDAAQRWPTPSTPT